VDSDAELRYHTEFCLVGPCLVLHQRLYVEYAPHAGRVTKGLFQGPGYDYLIANVAVGLAAVLGNWSGDIEKEPPD
jgi:hypothetical protein